MVRKTLVDLKLETIKEWEKYYRDPKSYVRKIKKVVKKYDELARVLLFGSVVKKKMRPDSDIDVIIITRLARDIDKRLKLRVEISREIGEYTPFEIHIVTPEEYENWYKKFIDAYIEL